MWYGSPRLMRNARYSCSSRTTRARLCGSVMRPSDSCASARCEHLGSQAHRAAHHKHQVARAVELQILEVRRELLTGELATARIERDHVGGRRNGLEHVGALIGKRTRAVAAGVAVGHLDDAHLRVRLEPLEVLVGGIAPVALLELADRNDGQLHCWAASEPTVTLRDSVWSPRTTSKGTTSPTL